MMATFHHRILQITTNIKTISIHDSLIKTCLVLWLLIANRAIFQIFVLLQMLQVLQRTHFANKLQFRIFQLCAEILDVDVDFIVEYIHIRLSTVSTLQFGFIDHSQPRFAHVHLVERGHGVVDFHPQLTVFLQKKQGDLY